MGQWIAIEERFYVIERTTHHYMWESDDKIDVHILKSCCKNRIKCMKDSVGITTTDFSEGDRIQALDTERDSRNPDIPKLTSVFRCDILRIGLKSDLYMR